MTDSFENPYAPPRPIEEEIPLAQFCGSLPIASHWRRLVGVSVDVAITMFAVIALNAVLPHVVTFAPSSAANLGEMLERTIYAAIYEAMTFIYIYVMLVGFMELISHRSPGKFAMSMRVVSIDGGVPTLSQIARRTLARFLLIEMFFYTKRFPISWHDWLSGTRVISVR